MISKIKSVFSDEYDCDLKQATAAPHEDPQVSSPSQAIDESHYKIAKPTRKVIRGKIINGTDS